MSLVATPGASLRLRSAYASAVNSHVTTSAQRSDSTAYILRGRSVLLWFFGVVIHTIM